MKAVISAMAAVLSLGGLGFAHYVSVQKAELATVEARAAAYEGEVKQLNDAAVTMQTACSNFTQALAKVQGPHDPATTPAAVGGGS